MAKGSAFPDLGSIRHKLKLLIETGPQTLAKKSVSGQVGAGLPGSQPTS
jgi:hypothetical protein